MCFAAMLIRRNYFQRYRFLSFLHAPLHYLYDVAYRNNQFYRSLSFGFFSLVMLLQQCVGSFFCFLLSEVDGDLPSLLIAVL